MSVGYMGHQDTSGEHHARADPSAILGSDRKFTLVVYRRDPFARAIARGFGQHPWYFFWVIFAFGLFLQYGLPAINGTLLPRPGFASSVADIPTSFSWVVINPFFAVLYVRQLTSIPELFEHLFAEGVTGLSNDTYETMLRTFDSAYNRIGWWILAVTSLLPLWALYIIAAWSSPYTYYHAANGWPWAVYIGAQILFDSAAIAYLIRYAITWWCLRTLLDPRQVTPRLYHDDGVNGFGSLFAFVQDCLIAAGLALLESVLLLGTGPRQLPNFLHSPQFAVVIVAGILYAVIAGFFLLAPLRVLFRALRGARSRLSEAATAATGAAIWSNVRHFERAEEVGDDASARASAHDLAQALQFQDDASRAIDSIPRSFAHAVSTSRQIIVLATALPPIATIAIRVFSSAVDWNKLVLSLLTSH